jgi:hypothetical protein
MHTMTRYRRDRRDRDEEGAQPVGETAEKVIDREFLAVILRVAPAMIPAVRTGARMVEAKTARGMESSAAGSRIAEEHEGDRYPDPRGQGRRGRQPSCHQGRPLPEGTEAGGPADAVAGPPPAVGRGLGPGSVGSTMARSSLLSSVHYGTTPGKSRSGAGPANAARGWFFYPTGGCVHKLPTVLLALACAEC